MKKLLLSLLAVTYGTLVFATDNTQFLADRHKAKGIPCASCHGEGKEPGIPTIDNCTTCHAVDALVEKTKGVNPKNPHVSPHYQNKLDCVNCHLGHEEPVNFCNQCHNFDFKVK